MRSRDQAGGIGHEEGRHVQESCCCGDRRAPGGLVYGKGSDSQYITRSKSKNGTSRFYSLATVHCVAGGSKAALGARLVKKTDNDGDVVSKLLEKCSELGIRSSRVSAGSRVFFG